MSIEHLANTNAKHSVDDEHHDFVTMTIENQLFGIPVLQVRDVLGPQHINVVPLAPKEVAGSLNLRGRIVTAIDVRTRLGLPPRSDDDPGMSVVVEHGSDLYSLIIDSVGEVLSLPASAFESNPSTLDDVWRDVTDGIYQLEDKLMVKLNIDRLLNFDSAQNE
ncbi:MAG: chemotaxis protein CheW [Proteobacteria bacterium]|nr:chemotaxis protein CheW [Pseudomonadota bacterium]MCH8097236.1 chemotaxis protein CheW [Pseudomonadota bacterium]